MDNVVIDTNSLIMAISSRSAYHKIWQSFLAGPFKNVDAYGLREI